ncbi:MAG: ATP-binding protein [Actinomycetia bacterium]|nr:ATP-binding protein [Actinomycetes bacterium]
MPRTPSYRARVVDGQLAALLRGAGAVVVEGAKACGKTTTALQVAASHVRLDRDRNARLAGLADPAGLLAGDAPRLIDEWQLVPDVWNAVRAEVDDRGEPGQFILTGSATPADDATRHSGAMRFVRMTMRPMSLFETGQGTGQVSLGRLWRDDAADTSDEFALTDIADAICRGGWPSHLGLDTPTCQVLNTAYLRTVASADIVTVDGIRRDPRKVGALLSAVGRNTATYVTNRRLQTDSAAFGAPIDPATIAVYLDALIRLWVVAEQPAWGGHLRSSAPARRAPKRHLVDPSLAVAAMGAEPDDLLRDHEALGQLFESLAFRDLATYAEAGGFEICSFQDAYGKKIDQVVVKGDQWAGIEVKLAQIPGVLDAAAAGLRAIAGRMTTTPRFLAIVTADGRAFTRPDGVHVVPLPALCP